MASNKRPPAEKEKMLIRISELYIRGFSQYKIADTLTEEMDRRITRAMVKRDLDKLRTLWMESAIRNFDEAKAEQLAKLDAIESQAWEQWEKSCRQFKKTKIETSKGTKGEIKQAIETYEREGDPRYLQIILSAIDKRNKLLGLDAPLKVASTNKDGDDSENNGVIIVPAVANSVEEWLEQYKPKS